VCTGEFFVKVSGVEDPNAAGVSRKREFISRTGTRTNTTQEPKKQSDTRQTERHRLNTQGNETQVETIRAWLETIRKERDKHREGRAGKQETRQGLQHNTGNTQILTIFTHWCVFFLIHIK